MALTANSFLKIVPITISGAEVIANVATRTYTNTRIENPETIAIYYNGQLIPGGENPVTPTSKYYFDYTIDEGSLDTGTGVVTGAQVIFNLRPNTAYTAPGYSSGTSDIKLNTYDSFVITYYYVTYSV